MLNAQITIHAAVLFYDGADCDQPALAEFNAIPAAANTYGNTTLAAYVATTDSLNPTNVRQRFQIFSSYATAQAVQILHEITMGMVPEIADVAGFQVSMSFQPVTRSFIQQGVHKGGNPQAVDIAKAPYFCKKNAPVHLSSPQTNSGSAQGPSITSHGLTPRPMPG
jgi:hypothetical protein